MMRKVLTALCLIGLLLAGCQKGEPKGRLEEITVKQLKEKFENQETFLFFVAQTGCDHCEAYRENLTEYIRDHELIMYYVEADKDENIDSFDELMDEYFPGVERTPTSIYVLKGVTQSGMVEGELDKAALETWFTRLGISLPLGEDG